MGAAISAARKELELVDDEVNRKQKLELDVLQKALDSQLNEFEAALDTKFLNPSSTEKTEVPGIRALRKVRFSNVVMTGGANPGVGDAVDAFFSIGDKGTDTGDAIKKGFKAIVTSALDAFMGNTSVGQVKERKYFIYMQHNSIVRLDVMLYKWNFGSKGFSAKTETAIGYVICTSIVDVAALKLSEFVYLISEYAGDDDQAVIAYINKMEKIYDTARRMKSMQIRNERRAMLEDADDVGLTSDARRLRE